MRRCVCIVAVALDRATSSGSRMAKRSRRIGLDDHVGKREQSITTVVITPKANQPQ